MIKNILNETPYGRKNLFELIAPECDKDVVAFGRQKDESMHSHPQT